MASILSRFVLVNNFVVLGKRNFKSNNDLCALVCKTHLILYNERKINFALAQAPAVLSRKLNNSTSLCI